VHPAPDCAPCVRETFSVQTDDGLARNPRPKDEDLATRRATKLQLPSNEAIEPKGYKKAVASNWLNLHRCGQHLPDVRGCRRHRPIPRRAEAGSRPSKAPDGPELSSDRSAAEGLDAAEHSAIIFGRRRAGRK
jgi:hypothetical protein